MNLVYSLVTLISILTASTTVGAVEYLLFPLQDKIRDPSKIGKSIKREIDQSITVENISRLSNVKIELFDGQTAILPSVGSMKLTFRSHNISTAAVARIIEQPEFTDCKIETKRNGAENLLSKVTCSSTVAHGRSRVDFEENFDGPLDGSKWGLHHNVNRDNALLSRDAFSVSEGIGNIKIYSKGGVHYSAFLNTSTRYTPIFGFYEAKVMMKPSSGNWCAFWLQQNLGNEMSSKSLVDTFGDSVPSDVARYGYGPEIDIAEVRRYYTQGQYAGNMSTGAIHIKFKDAEKMISTGFKIEDPSGVVDRWHTFGVNWTPGGYDLFYDGKLYDTVKTGVSHAPSQLLLTCEIKDNSWAGKIPAAGYKLEDDHGMKIDWVRVWR